METERIQMWRPYRPDEIALEEAGWMISTLNTRLTKVEQDLKHALDRTSELQTRLIALEKKLHE